jgi:hypothetical protein
MVLDYGHSLLNTHYNVVSRCISRHTYVLRGSTLKAFRQDVLESISTSIMINEGVGQWVPCLDPHIKKLHMPLVSAINRVYDEFIENPRKGPTDEDVE